MRKSVTSPKSLELRQGLALRRFEPLFVYNRDNGMMFEVKFGPTLPFSMSGPFDTGAEAIHQKE
jgi:hypothetical protein